MRNVFLALVGTMSAMIVFGIIANKAVPPSYSFADRAALQMLVDACRTGHHLCK